MKRVIIAALLAALTGPLLASVLSAGPIGRACMTSGRKAADRGLCNCIQVVADSALTRSDQRLAAKFFRDPHKAQEIRQSDSANHETFWQRYKGFGNKAERVCARS